MAVPSTIVDLNVVAASNSPAGADTVASNTGPDEYFRALSAIIKREQSQGTATASAATIDLGAITTGSYLHITGSTGPITSFGTVAAGVERTLVFDSTPTITYHATSMILLGGASRTMAAGDISVFRSEGSGNWREVARHRASDAEVVSVRRFGAKGDGATDDTAAITAAIAYGGRIYFPSGTYKITTPITIATDNVVLIGENQNNTILDYSSGTANTFCITIQRADHATAVAEPFLVGNSVQNFGFSLAKNNSALRVYLVTRGIFQNLRAPSGINNNDAYNQPVFQFEGGVFNTIIDLMARGDLAPLTTKAKYLFKFVYAVWGAGSTRSDMTNCRIHGIYGAAAKIGTLLQTYSAIHELTMELCEEYGVELGDGNWNALHDPWFEYNAYDIKLNTYFSATNVGNCRIYNPFTIGYTNAMVDAEAGVLEIHGLRRYINASYAPLIKPPATFTTAKTLYIAIDNFPSGSLLAPDATLAAPLPFYQAGMSDVDYNLAFDYKQIRVLSDEIQEVLFVGPSAPATGVHYLTTGIGIDTYRLSQKADLLGLHFYVENVTGTNTFTDWTVEVDGATYFTRAAAAIDGINFSAFPRRNQLAAGSKIKISVNYQSVGSSPIICKMVLGNKPRESMTTV